MLLWSDPVDDRRKRPSRKKSSPKPPAVEDNRPILADPLIAEAVKGPACPGCGCDLFDITHRAMKVLIWGARPTDCMRSECVWCGLATWGRTDLPEIGGLGYQFRSGVFAGKTVGQVLDMPGGKDYVYWCAANGKEPAARKACQETI